MHQRETPLFKHRSQPVTPQLLSQYYWIIVMEVAHKEAILKVDKETGSRIFTFREFGHIEGVKEPDMPDPTGKEIEDYKVLFDILDREMPHFITTIFAKVDDLKWNENITEDY